MNAPRQIQINFNRHVSSRFRDPVSIEKERELVRKAQGGCDHARNLLVEHNGGLLYRFAYKYHQTNMHIELDEFVNAGAEGILLAIPRYDPTSKNRFISYAQYWIHQRMRVLIEQGRIIRLPSNIPTELRQVERGERETNKRLEAAKEATQIASLDKPIGGDGEDEATLMDTMRSNIRDAVTEYRFKRMHEDIDLAILTLSDGQRKVIKLHYGLETGYELTLEQVGKAMGFTKERARQVRNTGLKRLAFHKHLKKYLRLF